MTIHHFFKQKNKALLVTLSCAALSLTACQMGATGSSDEELNLSKIDAILERAASDAAKDGKVKESLELLDNMYKRNPTNSAIALRYARALRHHGNHQKASLILSGHVNAPEPKPAILTEYAALQAAQGHYLSAEETARRSILIEDNQPRAYHVLGIALDAQSFHKEAEVAFRRALENWAGDPVPVLNNLGLNLAAQGHLDNALETLRKASAAAPNREEIERNIRIVSALQNKSGVYGSYFEHNAAPTPSKKPQEKADTASEEAEKSVKPETKPEKAAEAKQPATSPESTEKEITKTAKAEKETKKEPAATKAAEKEHAKKKATKTAKKSDVKKSAKTDTKTSMAKKVSVEPVKAEVIEASSPADMAKPFIKTSRSYND